jgi:hypothetical protein
MNEEKCPCCPNHCLKDNLGCGRGRDYFNNQNNSFEPNTLNEKIIMDLRKCGHLLHHNRDLNTETILANFSDDELNELHKLLSKIHRNLE